MALFNIFNSKPLTLGELMNIDPSRQQKSMYQSVELDGVFHRVKKESIWDRIKRFFSRDKTSINMYYVILKFMVSSNSGNKYSVIIEFQPNPNMGMLMNNKVRIYCECADFKFRSAYILNKRGNLYRSSRTDVSLGQALTDAPDERKTRVSTACKHVAACVNWLNNNMGYITNIL